MIYIEDIIAEITAKVSEKMLELHEVEVSFMHGHPLEIIDCIKKMITTVDNESVDKKYPAIMLIHDIKQNKGEKINILSTANLNIVICNLADNNLLAEDRKEQSFKPILHPIYEEFLTQIFLSNKFVGIDHPQLIPHTQTDRYYWGRKGLFGLDQNLFSDYVDAITIDNLNLKIKNKINCSL